MTTPLKVTNAAITYDAIARDVKTACASIAPAWPLDRLIAVNPWWSFVDRPIATAAAELQARSGVHLLMPRAWYREQWAAHRFAEAHIARAIQLDASTIAVKDVVATLQRDDAPREPRRLMTDVIDARRDLSHEVSWADFVTRSLSQACAAFFDDGQSRWTPDRSAGLYPMWRELAKADRAPRLLMGLRGFREQVATLPESPSELIALAVRELGISPADRDMYFAGLLMTVNGWASAAAFRRWEARLLGRDDNQIEHLLAARLAWELILLRTASGDVLTRWRSAQREWATAFALARQSQAHDWIMQRAMELAYQDAVVGMLRRAADDAQITSPATVQAVFCIDVRSEVYRRALEHVAPAAQTLGFAGFFGLPIAFQPTSGAPRPQLPGLLAPTLTVAEVGAARDDAAQRSRRALALQLAVKDFMTTASSAFSAVESTGLLSVAALVRDGFALNGLSRDPLLTTSGVGAERLRMELVSPERNGEELAIEQRVTLAVRVLTAMNLTRDFAPVVALIGHGAGTENNPQACGLHCGACGGQTGEVNARSLASLLNDSAVRAGLAEQGIVLSRDTHVVAGLHNTTTDDITLFDLDLLPGSHRDAVARFRTQLDAASARARAERASRLGIDADANVHDAMRSRAVDWSEVRPEWGLARNAAFVVAPRARTRGRNLDGRAFLHEYDCENDTDSAVLEGILTAPMLVTHWINMQYWASMVDNARYGSGNKVLHNVVGGRLGVLEGAVGDLRIGLAMQSLHDGREWVHEPLRLSVFVEAPAAAIDDILERHRVVRDLVLNEWVFLYRIEPSSHDISQRRADGWHTV